MVEVAPSSTPVACHAMWQAEGVCGACVVVVCSKGRCVWACVGCVGVWGVQCQDMLTQVPEVSPCVAPTQNGGRLCSGGGVGWGGVVGWGGGWGVWVGGCGGRWAGGTSGSRPGASHHPVGARRSPVGVAGGCHSRVSSRRVVVSTQRGSVCSAMRVYGGVCHRLGMGEAEWWWVRGQPVWATTAGGAARTGTVPPSHKPTKRGSR